MLTSKSFAGCISSDGSVLTSQSVAGCISSNGSVVSEYSRHGFVGREVNSHLCPMKCHLIFLSYGPGLTSMQHSTLHITAVQSPSHCQ